MDFPQRLGWRTAVVSPDYPGCINSGMQVALLKSETARDMIGKPFVVGPRIHVSTVYEQIRTAPKYRRVKFYKTYRAAKKAFLKMYKPIQDAYAEVEAAKEQARKPIKTADDYARNIDAHMTLVDNGII